MKRIVLAMGFVAACATASTLDAQQMAGEWNIHTTATWVTKGGSPAQSVGVAYALPLPLPANLGIGTGVDVSRSSDCLFVGLTAGPVTNKKLASYAGAEIQLNRSDFYTGARQGFAGYVGLVIPRKLFLPVFNVEARMGHVNDAGSTAELRFGFNL